MPRSYDACVAALTADGTATGQARRACSLAFWAEHGVSPSQADFPATYQGPRLLREAHILHPGTWKNTEFTAEGPDLGHRLLAPKLQQGAHPLLLVQAKGHASSRRGSTSGPSTGSARCR